MRVLTVDVKPISPTCSGIIANSRQIKICRGKAAFSLKNFEDMK